MEESSTAESQQDDQDMGCVHTKLIKWIFCCLRDERYQTGNYRYS